MINYNILNKYENNNNNNTICNCINSINKTAKSLSKSCKTTSLMKNDRI